MDPNGKKLYASIRVLRSCFNQLKELSDTMCQDLGVNASMRAVMESLAELGPITVPDIAREKGVSRQHIQVNVDALLRCDCVETVPNPAHKRSPLIALTKKGAGVFSNIRNREAALLDQLAKAMPDGTIESLGTDLDIFRRELELLSLAIVMEA